MDASVRETGTIIDPVDQTTYEGTVHVEDGHIGRIERHSIEDGPIILPGFIDAHVHVESSMLPPSEFARAAVRHGTVATVSDPHEIANVLGIEGVEYMIDDGEQVPFKFYFGAPSCVPATPFETAGAELGPDAVEALLQRDDIKYLSEMMNYPGAIERDATVMAKIEAAERLGKPCDGHAPGVEGADAAAYAEAGISTDHESVTIEEARDKLAAGMKIMIREGSAAKNFDELIPLMDEAPERLMFCTDDAHPDALMQGHIDALVRRAISRGYDAMDVLRAACVHPVEHYDLDVGLLQTGDPADFIVADDLEALHVQRTYIGGERVAEGRAATIERTDSPAVNNFTLRPTSPEDFAVLQDGNRMRIIEAADNQLVTSEEVVEPRSEDGRVVSDPERDLLKLAVVNRYEAAEPACAFIRGFGLDRGALASSVAHDSHNVVAVGASDEALSRAVNVVMEHRGGIAAVSGDAERVLPLPIAGLMTDQPYDEVADEYLACARVAQEQLGSTMDAPFMTLSFMALLVIPKLKLSDRGLFDGDAFSFVDLWVE